jgi:Peptidase family M1 domain
MGRVRYVAICAALSFAILAFPLAGSAQTSAGTTPRQIYDALNGLRINSEEVYHVGGVRIRRDSISITLDDGELGFFEDYGGRVTGAVFTGRGHVIGVVREASEQESLAQFLGMAMLDEPFSDAYLRFTDSTAKELLDQIAATGATKVNDADFLARWNQALPALDPGQSLRILADILSEQPAPFFQASLQSDHAGIFDVVVDDAREEQVSIGQTRRTNGVAQYDVWAQFARANGAGEADAFEPVSYNISTVIEADHTLEGETTIALRAARGGERILELELSRDLTVQSVEDVTSATATATPSPLDFFQNNALSTTQVAELGDDLVRVVLPHAARTGEVLRLKLVYRGGVISDAGNGVLFVGDRGSWYPHIGGFGHFAAFDLAFRWPRHLRLVATGDLIDQSEDGDWQSGRWHADAMNVAGFNLGEYSSETVTTPDGVKIEVLANDQLEKAMAERLAASAAADESQLLLMRPTTRQRGALPAQAIGPLSPAPPSPASQLHEVGQQIADAVRLEERWMGPLPSRTLEVSQIPGEFGQGWPGLLYLPTLTFLPAQAQQSAGVSRAVRRDFSEIMPFHEVAHQWWGNEIGWQSYRDEWIGEGLANYIALMAVDARQPGEHVLSDWLTEYRTELTAMAPGGSETIEESGALVLGYRLESSSNSDAYAKITYGKGTWVFHMLRMMLRDPRAADPDARFTALLRGLAAKYTHAALSTDGLEQAVERAMTPAMDLEGGHSMEWFFDEWVRETGIPHYSVSFDARKTESGWVLKGTLTQDAVPEAFVAAVPIYAQGESGKPVLLGTVTTSGQHTAFRLVTQIFPRRLLIDPQQTLLCTHE